jgi:hypothetical protein
MALITDPDFLNDGTEISIDTSNLLIGLSATGSLTTDGVTLQCVYSKCKELWKSNANYIKFAFPMLSITEEKFELQNGWNFKDINTKNLIRTGGWALKDNGGVTQEEYAGVITLGDISTGGQIYYQQAIGLSSTDIVLPGAVNQPIKIFGTSAYGGINFRDYLNLFVREQGKTYADASLSDIGVSTMTYQCYRFPLSNATDLKISHTDAHIVSASPYTGMNIAWSTSAIPLTMGVSAYNFHVNINANNGTAEEVYEFVQYQLRQNTDIDVGPTSAIGKVTNSLLRFVGDTLYSNLDTGNPTTSGGVYISNFQSSDTNRLVFTDDINTPRTYPFVAVITLQFGDNLRNDTSAIYRVFFTNDDAGDNTGRDFGTINAILVKDNSNVNMSNLVSGASSIQLTFDYDGNVQRGNASAGKDAPITAVGIGLSTAQYVTATGTILKSTSNSLSLVAALERNYSNL